MKSSELATAPARSPSRTAPAHPASRPARRSPASCASPLRNEFSWSLSRDRVLRECARKYYYTHYGMWGGWSVTATPRARELYVLKNLKTRQMWAGTVVHEAIGRSIAHLRNGRSVLPPDEVVEITLARMRADWIASKRRQNRADPKRRVGLFEHEFALPVSPAEWRATAAIVDGCLRGFYASPLYRRLRAVPPAMWLDAGEPRGFPLDLGDMTVRAWVQIDAAYRGDEGSVVLANWRTGRAGAERKDEQLQTATQALYAMATWQVPLDRLRIIDLSLIDGDERRLAVSGADLEAARASILGSVRDMQALLADSAQNVAREDDFPKTADLERCLACSFRRLCRGRGIAGRAAASPANSRPAPVAPIR
ncbi:MAG: PD-(D/E)XK nuclease family protein [Deltaproteobacteria bacterium]|nr:PD-(D/E)XK nuclease family protein [Deltaproteobacteria bacterium]